MKKIIIHILFFLVSVWIGFLIAPKIFFLGEISYPKSSITNFKGSLSCLNTCQSEFFSITSLRLQ